MAGEHRVTTVERTHTSEITQYSDWRINVEYPDQSIVFPGPSRVYGPSAEHAHKMAGKIVQHFQSSNDEKRCLLKLEDYRYRVQRVRPNLYAARTLLAVPLRLAELGYPLEYQRLFLSQDFQRTGGLIVIFGTTGAGKTTTAAATVISRLETQGGFCLAVEDPPESNLEGFHGPMGYAEQMDASDIGYEQALLDALRCFPSAQRSMLFLGEIRSKDSAYEALKASLEGHLVITTMHAKDIVSGLTRLASLAASAGEANVRTMMAEGLVLAVHQSRENGISRLSALRFNPIASAVVQNGAFYHLQDEILKQNKLLQVQRG